MAAALAVAGAGAGLGAAAAAPAAAAASAAAQPAVVLAATPAATPLPGDSLYQLKSALTDQDGHAFGLASRRGHAVLVSMFYNSCQFVCPMLIDTMRMTEQQLSADERAQLSMLLITFDPARDDVKALRTVAKQRELDVAHWTLARSDAASVRKIAATLGIQYRLLGNGEFNHTTVLVLLDQDGRIAGRSTKMGTVDPEFLALIHKTIGKPASAN
ncbi:MAG: SCO family protein [Pseudomonadota bacterium]